MAGVNAFDMEHDGNSLSKLLVRDQFNESISEHKANSRHDVKHIREGM